MWAPKDGRWGARVPGRGWNGIVGELLRGEADLSLRLFWSADRKMAIDFTRAYIFEPFVMVTRRPGPLQQSLAPVRPFTGMCRGEGGRERVDDENGGSILYTAQSLHTYRHKYTYLETYTHEGSTKNRI